MFLRSTQNSPKVNAGGPTPKDQFAALCEDRYWFTLNTHLFKHDAVKSSNLLCDRVNAFKMLLQTFGSSPAGALVISNKNTKNSVFHTHIPGNTGTTFVLEWAVIDSKKRILAIVGFGSHENYKFVKKPLNKDDHKRILNDPLNIKIIDNATKKIDEAKAKKLLSSQQGLRRSR